MRGWYVASVNKFLKNIETFIYLVLNNSLAARNEFGFVVLSIYLQSHYAQGTFFNNYFDLFLFPLRYFYILFFYLIYFYKCVVLSLDL